MIPALLKNRSVQVFAAVSVYLAAASFLPMAIHQGFYTVSLLIKDLLIWILPVSVGFFIAHAISSFERRAPLFIFFLFLFEAVSNSASVWYAYGCGHLASAHMPSIEPHPFSDSFHALWRLPILKPAWWSADKGTFAGIALGLISTLKLPSIRKFVVRGKESAEWLLTRIFSRLIPLFVLGFVARMHQTKILSRMMADYSSLLGWLVMIIIAYIALLFLLGTAGSPQSLIKSVRNLFPAAGIAFSSGCSLSTMPWTIEGTAKNLQNPGLAKSIIPATTNIQQIGDCIANSFLCFLIYRHFNGHNPDLSVWLAFSLVFVLARYAAAAVIGGTIFIMLPIYESYLGFNAEMIAIILAFNVILDPLITCSNVVANGALCRVFERAWHFILRRPVAIKENNIT